MKKLILIIIALSIPVALSSQNLDSGDSPTQERDNDTSNGTMAEYIRGIAALNNSDYPLALEHLNSARQRNPESSGISYALSDVYLSLEDYANAEYFALEAIELNPENKWYYLKLARIYKQDRQNSRALEILEKARDFLPGDRTILLQLAELNAEFRNFEESNRIYDKILELKGPNPEIFHKKYQNHMRENEPERGIGELYRILELEPDNPGTIHLISRMLIEVGELDEAHKLLREALERNSRNPETLILLAEIYIMEARWENLGDTFVSMIRDPLFSTRQKMELARFLYLRYQSAPDQSILAGQTRRVLESLSRNEPEYGDAHLLAAEYFLDRNDTGRAVEMLKLANSVMPEDGEAWRQRLQLIFSDGDYEEVIRVGLEAGEHVRDDAVISFLTGTSYMLTEQYDGAAEKLEEATFMPSRRSFRSVIFSTLADVYVELGRWDDAISYYEDALRLDSSNHNAMNNYAWHMTERGERMDEAKELSQQAVQHDPGNAAYLDTLGWIFFKEGEYERALDYIRSAVDTGNAGAETFEHLGDIYHKLGQTEEAKAWWGKAMETDPGRSYLKNRINTP